MKRIDILQNTLYKYYYPKHTNNNSHKDFYKRINSYISGKGHTFL